MMLPLKPLGRGGWTPVALHIPMQRREFPRPLEVRLRQHVTINGRVYRVARIEP